MQEVEVFEKIIEKLEEKGEDDTCGGSGCLWKDDAVQIVKDVGKDCNNGWIPCSERLPEKNGIYLVSYENLNCYPGTCIFVNGKFNDTHILAWQPLPGPYVEGGGE